MSSYHTSFTFLDKNSYNDFNLQVVHFESGDNGETDSYLSQESIYADSVRGTKRTLYGTKYDSVISLDITVMHPDGAEFSIKKTREIYKWLTGSTQYSWMDLYVGEEVKYRLLCFIQNVRPYKIDSRVVGFIITAESSSPWCYSPLQTITQTVSGDKTLTIDNASDDMYVFTPMQTVFENTTGTSLTITNKTLNEKTQIDNIAANETITLSDNMMITSDKQTRVFGNDFNYIWPRLKCGVNQFTISGTGTVTFKYIYCIKVGDCVGDLNAAADPICDEDGKIILDKLDWNRIINTPTTLGGYGITDVYSKVEVDKKIQNVTISNNTINIDETELIAMLNDVLV